MIDLSDILNAAVLGAINTIGYVALGKRLERVERKIDTKVDVEHHDEVVREIRLQLTTKANRL